MQKEISTNVALKELSHLALFKYLAKLYPDQDHRFSCHFPSGIVGGLSLLESASIVGLLKLVQAREAFEFGTYLGATTVLMANNDNALKITTLDLEPDKIMVTDREKLDQTKKSENDDYLRALYQDLGARYITRADSSIQQRVQQLKLDSRQLNTAQLRLEDRFEFIFVDGGHDLDIVSSDTEKSLAMLKKDSLLIWHDYGSKIHTDVTLFLDQRCSLRPLYQIQHTMLAIHPRGRFQSIFEEMSTI